MTDFNQETLAMALYPRAVRFYEEVDSTNIQATAWLLDGAPNLATVIAESQTAGKGRLGRQWRTPHGQIAVSTIVQGEVGMLARLPLLVSLAVYDLLEQFGIQGLSVKWPNDVLVGDKKISGTLCESVWSGNQCLGAVVGIGINVNADFRDTPLAHTAIALSSLVNHPIDRVACLAVLLYRLDEWLEKLDSDEWLAVYRARLSLLNRPITLKQEHGFLHGVALDVAQDGALLVQDDSGQIQPCYAGEVTSQG